ncbi:MAG: large-conductance mechanosensitive channel protein MscL [Desulfuromonadales bacterium]
MGMGMVKEFKEFVARGNVMDMAIGIILGAAFGAITKSMVDDVLMPPIGLLLGGVDFSNLFVVLREGIAAGPYLTVADAKAAGAVILTYGIFFQTVINFLIIAIAVFLLMKGVNRLKRALEEPPAVVAVTRDCPYCTMAIPLQARRCPQCTSEIK